MPTDGPAEPRLPERALSPARATPRAGRHRPDADPLDALPEPRGALRGPPVRRPLAGPAARCLPGRLLGTAEPWPQTRAVPGRAGVVTMVFAVLIAVAIAQSGGAATSPPAPSHDSAWHRSG